jgi:hypothetical protein
VIVKQHRSFLQMASREFIFDPRLPAQQPVHGFIQLILIPQLQPQKGTQRTGRGLLPESTLRGELGSRGEYACHNQGAYQIALGRRGARHVGFQADVAQGAESGRDVAMGPGALDFERLGGRDQSFTLEDPAEQIDLGGRPVGD